MTGDDLRQSYLDFFKSKEHLVLKSYPLVPENDPSLLLIGAGMAPFKAFFTGKMKPPCYRIATSQKCVRTGDIENVGKTARHHTFFEMLGNFSFGDYFKKEAIFWAWEYLTEHLEMPPDKLWISIHTSDDEAFDIWHNDINISKERIIRMDDSFWEIGSGPCGPCSEIYFDLGPERGCGKDGCMIGCNCDRYLEIWNLVFTQLDRDDAGNYTPLEKKNIDTGAGLERIASLLQNKPSNFETDLLFPIIEHVSALAEVKYGQLPKTDISLKVIADHARSMTVMIADGVLPSNEGRGYVLRRIMRRAVRHGRILGIDSDKNFLKDTVHIVAEIFALAYPEIKEKKEYIEKVAELEEERFQKTLFQGMELLNKEIQTIKQNGEITLDGTVAFKLYDTYGFPLELTKEILEEQNIAVDTPGFESAMNEQRQRARAARAQGGDQFVLPDLSKIATHEWYYNIATDSANIVLLFKDGNIVEEVFDGEEAALVLNVTPFYAESGGQVGDTGYIIGNFGKMAVFDTKKLPDGTIYHLGHIENGVLKSGEHIKATVNAERARHIARNHTATHLLHAALKKILGEHVNQAGSLVDADKLRFDFTHFSSVDKKQLDEIEEFVNSVILCNSDVDAIETTQKEAKEIGAVALFGEKYGDMVRVVTIGDFSKELCGGIHVGSAAEIGIFKILTESGIGSGLRRIEAVTGQGAYEQVKKGENILKSAASALKCRADDLVGKIDSTVEHVKELEKELSGLKNKLVKNEVEYLLKNAQTLDDTQKNNGLKVVAGEITSASDMEMLRFAGDMIRDRLKGGVVVLGAVFDGKVNFLAMVAKEAVASGIHAGNIVKAAAEVTGGGGGGRPDMAQAGGKNPEKLAAALSAAVEVICSQVKR
jgi:alanyl-tRNA synthetase